MKALLADIGSTYTKLSAVDLDRASLLARCEVPTTPADITQGVGQAQEKLSRLLGGWPDFALRRAASSAAGGLRMIAVGLVPDLTGEAARLAALGAGAKVLKVYGHRLQEADVREIMTLSPDVILLSGGTDGGDREVILENAAMLAGGALTAAIVVAGNRDVAQKAAEQLAVAGLVVRLADNVMPRLGEIRVEDARSAIRTLFIERIVQAKGLNRLELDYGQVVMPTPAAVMSALTLLAAEWGELLAVDIGGATTDVYSLATGAPTDDALVPVGLKMPYALRTVEADLGMRISAPEVWRLASSYLEPLAAQQGFEVGDFSAWVESLVSSPAWAPQTPREHSQESLLGKACVKLATSRHVGRVEVMVTPVGNSYLQRGKDLRRLQRVIGTGGVLRHSQNPADILAGAVADPRESLSLKPQRPIFYYDVDYILAAAGLLADSVPTAALRLIENSLQEISPSL